MITNYHFEDADGTYQYTSQTSAPNYLPINYSMVKTDGNIFTDDIALNIAGDRIDEQPWYKWSSGVDSGNVSLVLLQGIDVVYRGNLTGVEVSFNTMAFKFASRLRIKKGARRRYQRSCNYQLFDTNTCKAPQTLVAVNVASWIETRITTVLPIPNHTNYINGWLTHRGKNYWIVDMPDRNTIVTNHIVVGLGVNRGLVIRAGCNKVLETCAARFSNDANYGGYPHYPEEQPFGKIFGEKDDT